VGFAEGFGVGGSPLLGRASKVCYVYGFWTIVVTLVNVTLYSSILTLEATQTLFLLILVAMLPLSILFGFYTYRLGDEYDVNALLEAGFLCIASEIMSLAIASPAFLGGAILFFSQTVSFLGSVLFFVVYLLLLAAGIIFPIVFIIGLSGLKERTHLDEFGRAMALAIGGFLIPGLFGLAVIQFGVGLSSLAKLGEAS
jgi:hypothetical protein